MRHQSAPLLAALEAWAHGPWRGPTGAPDSRLAKLHEELKRRSVTLVLLWHSDGYGYSRFCDLFGEWRRRVSATMRQTHVAGEKPFADFAGNTRIFASAFREIWPAYWNRHERR